MAEPVNSKQAEKEYLKRSGSLAWEQLKPFAPRGAQTLHDSLPLMHDFSVAVTALELLPGHRVLDLGVGSCWTTEWLARLNIDVVATDIAVDMLSVGRERVRDLDAGLVTGDLEALPFAAQSFDRALCMNALHHIPDPSLALREIARVLKPSGRLVLIEPGQGHAEREASQHATREFGVLEQELEATHLMQLCTQAGFTRVVVRPLSYMTSEIELDRDQLATWRSYLQKNRPSRALHKLWYLMLEVAGARKREELFEDMLSILLSRVVGRHVFEQSLIVADRSEGVSGRKAYAAAIEVRDPRLSPDGSTMTMSVRCRNTGTSTWRASGSRRVQLGIQVLDADKVAIARDHHRVALDRDVPPGEEWTRVVELTRPAEGGYLRADLVAEGVAWFDATEASAIIPRAASGA
jgi:ubiquinone/menaquinone biosynthesis C-methylase UbiE